MLWCPRHARPRRAHRVIGYTADVKPVPRRSSLTLVGLAISTVMLAACQKPLLSPEEERSPFDRYDVSRNQHADQYVTDPFGRRRPNLRERLGQKE